MTSRSFALSSLIAAIPGAAVAALIVMAILNHSGEIFASIPLAASLIVALICGVVVTLAPIVIFFRGRGEPARSQADRVPRAGNDTVLMAEASSDELGVTESSAILAAAGTGASSSEMLIDEEDDDEFADSAALADSEEFLEADSAEFDAADEDSFSDFDDEEDEGDSFFDEPARK